MKSLTFWVLLVSSTVPMWLHAETKIESPDWEFSDSFEGSLDDSFWGRGVKTAFGGQCTSDPSYPSPVLRFDYPSNATSPDGNNGWSEQRFAFPASQQLEISYRLFVPSNYVPSPRNHKNIALWSGEYGVANANVALFSESWPTGKGGQPSLYLGEDGNNYGHALIESDDFKPIYPTRAGKWQSVHIYLELAEEEGDYGVMEIFVDGELITATHHPDISQGYNKPPTTQRIAYASRGNYLDRGYLLGWANDGFQTDTVFCLDNFSAKGRYAVGESEPGGGLAPPQPPSGLSVTSSES